MPGEDKHLSWSLVRRVEVGPREQAAEVGSLVRTGLRVAEPSGGASGGRCPGDAFWREECQNLQVGSGLGARSRKEWTGGAFPQPSFLGGLACACIPLPTGDSLPLLLLFAGNSWRFAFEWLIRLCSPSILTALSHDACGGLSWRGRWSRSRRPPTGVIFHSAKKVPVLLRLSL